MPFRDVRTKLNLHCENLARRWSIGLMKHEHVQDLPANIILASSNITDMTTVESGHYLLEL